MISQDKLDNLTDGVEKVGKDTWISSAQSRKRTQEARSFGGFKPAKPAEKPITIELEEEDGTGRLQDEIDFLRREVSYLRSLVDTNNVAPEDYDDLPFRFVFLAQNPSGVTFTERTVVGGAIVDSLTKRTGTFIEPAEDEVFLVAFNDPASSTQKFVKIAGGTGGTVSETIGTIKGQVHSMVSNFQDGWDFPVTVI